jgi:hypothetical protein
MIELNLWVCKRKIGNLLILGGRSTVIGRFRHPLGCAILSSSSFLKKK